MYASPEQVRREQMATFAEQIYLAAVHSGQHRDAADCAKDAKALYAELDKADGGEGEG
jgi:hypothetical protein